MKKEFASTLQYDEATIKGLFIDSSKVAIAQVIGLPKTRVEYVAHVDAVAAREEFYK
jgi:hypothetical protein